MQKSLSIKTRNLNFISFKNLDISNRGETLKLPRSSLWRTIVMMILIKLLRTITKWKSLEYTITVADDATTMPIVTAAEQTSLKDPADIIGKIIKDRECCPSQDLKDFEEPKTVWMRRIVCQRALLLLPFCQYSLRHLFSSQADQWEHRDQQCFAERRVVLLCVGEECENVLNIAEPLTNFQRLQ